MKSKIILLLTILPLLYISNSIAQISQGGTPPSFSLMVKKSAGIPKTTLPKIRNVETLLEEDAANPIPFRYSILEEVNIDIKNKGGLILDEQGNSIWQYNVSSEEAFSLGLVFEKFNLPEGAKLFVYSPDRKNILGAFTSENNKSSGRLSLQELKGKEAIIEYYEPKGAEYEGELILGGVGQAYKNLFEDLPDSAFIGINCPIGDEWQLEKHAIVKYTSYEGTSGFSCTGFLVNNTNEDATPYMITANHCISSTETAQNMVAYFNYEKEDCQSGIILTPQSISEATLLATYKTYDFSLVRLSQAPPASYQPYYAGWNRTGKESPMGISISHPRGDVKGIAFDYDTVEVYPYQVTTSDHHGNINILPPSSTWYIYHDRGLTTQGSSGSPLFDNQKKVIGILSAGDKDDNRESFYIRFDKAWNPANSDINQELMYWLDPKNSSLQTLNGYLPFPNTTPPDAHFMAEYRGSCPGAAIQLTDKTVFGANSWQWEFSPNSVSYVEGHSNSQNPVVSFDEEGEYTVSLTVGNSAGSSKQTRNSYINTVGPYIKTRRLNIYSTCASAFNTAKILVTGAQTYHWFLDDSQADYLRLQNIDNDTLTVELETGITLKTNSITSPDSTIVFKLYVEGFIDSCSSIEEYDLQLKFHDNDNIADALPLLIDSLQGPFDNSCATVEENEPIPQVDDCTTQGEWCGCELGNEYRFILGNSTWFTFIAPESGIVGIETFGYDNQIAVYDAESAEDILSDNPAKYDIIGANDDFSDTDFFAKIPSLTVTPGKKYWIQADGSSCNATGQFTIRITSEAIVDVETNFAPSQNIAGVYPNPANDMINIRKKSSSDLLELSIFDIKGKQILRKQIKGDSEQIDIKHLARGMYFIQIIDRNEIQVTKLVLE